MTSLKANTALIAAFGQEPAPSTNPEQDFALMSGTMTDGGLVAWFGRTALGRALTGRSSPVAIKRLSELSPHLLADVGMLEASTPDAGMPAGPARTAPAPVAPRPAQRPAIPMPSRVAARSTTQTPIRTAPVELRAAR